MKQLELKHIAPYLPYGLKATFEGDDCIHEVVGLNIASKGVELISPFGDYGRADIEDCKLILRPLSDIHKEIVHNGKKFIPVRELESIRKGLDIYKPLNLDYPIEVILETENYSQDIDLYDGYLVIQKIIEWHFDISSLIEKGVAIDINDLKEDLK